MVFYILITCDTYSDQIEKEIKKVLPKDVKYEFESVYGVYDAIIKIDDNIDGKSDNVRELIGRIKGLPKIHTAMVLTVAD